MNKRVLLVAGDGKKRDFINKIPEINPQRYHAFRKVFGERNFGIVEAGDLKNQILSKEEVSPFWLDSNLMPHVYQEKGLECSLIVPSNFLNSGKLPSQEEVSWFLDYLEEQKDKGVIKNIVNSKRSTLFEDKASIIDLQKKGFKVPKSYFISGSGDLFSIIDKEKSYILKPRFGYEGRGILKLLKDNLEFFNANDLEKYILQEEIDIQSESRLIFFDYEFLGARIIHDRRRPWEDKDNPTRRHKVEKYSPSAEEIEEARNILKYSDTVWGCIDFAHDKKGNFKYLELNGVGTGLGFKGGPYDFNEVVANKIKEKYLK